MSTVRCYNDGVAGLHSIMYQFAGKRIHSFDRIVDAAMLNQPIQYNFNIIKPEPMERISSYGPAVASGGSFPLYSVGTTSPQPQSSMQTLR